MDLERLLSRRWKHKQLKAMRLQAKGSTQFVDLPKESTVPCGGSFRIQKCLFLCCLLDLPLVFLGHLFRTLLTEIFKNDTENINEISGISHSAEWSPGSQSRTPRPTTVERSWGVDLRWKIASSCCSQNEDSSSGESPDTQQEPWYTICHDYLTNGNHWRKTTVHQKESKQKAFLCSKNGKMRCWWGLKIHLRGHRDCKNKPLFLSLWLLTLKAKYVSNHVWDRKNLLLKVK